MFKLLTKSIKDNYSHPCPIKYLNPKYPDYIKDSKKRKILIEKIKSKKVKRWIGHNIIFDDDNNIINNVVELKKLWTKNKKIGYNCICSKEINSSVIGCVKYDVRNGEQIFNANICYSDNHNKIMLDKIEREKLLKNIINF